MQEGYAWQSLLQDAIHEHNPVVVEVILLPE
jgi:hypothetical protein